MSEHANVCVIDDDREVLTITCQLLELCGFHPRGYERVQDFLAEFDDASVECVVTDLRMPDIDGAELHRRLREKGSVVSLILLTGFANLDGTQQMRNDESLTILEKPYDPERFMSLVAQAIEYTRQRRKHGEQPLAASQASVSHE